MIELLRIDDKLIHAQMVWGWVRKLNASCIIVANDEAAHDKMRKNLFTIAAQSMDTSGQITDVRILSLEEAAENLKHPEIRKEKVIIVVSKPADVVFLIENGITVKDVSLGWMSISPGKKRILETVSVGEEDIDAFRALISKGVNVKYQASPSDVQLDISDLLADVTSC